DLRNVSKTPALMVRIKLVREKSGDLIAPALFDDNYIALMPGERRTLHVQVQDQDTRGETPKIIVEGYNLANPGKIVTPTLP
ncbi:MAG TPA: glycoside hydrolase family 2 protein, partial [Acidobacteriaceae bacterium]|nr:glycoside hydrolase family 2 protein [Acidobacteriaceae bacterium]